MKLKRKSLLSWILTEPSAYTIPSIRIVDKILIILSRIFYIAIRLFLTIILGKRTERSQFYHKLSMYVSRKIVFHFIFLCFSIRSLEYLG
jgi:hypothetical protein